MSKEIEFYPKLREMAEIFPHPVPAITMLPDWWKQMSTYIGNNMAPKAGMVGATVKKCQPIFDSMTSGYYILCPVDIYIDASTDVLDVQVPWEWKNDAGIFLSNHSMEQIQQYPNSKNHPMLVRIHPRWGVKTPAGYSSMFLNPMHISTQITAVPAFVDTDTYISDGFFSFFVERGFVGTIERGTPLVQVIPVKRDSWETVINEDPNSNLIVEKQKKLMGTVFHNRYKRFWSRKEYK